MANKVTKILICSLVYVSYLESEYREGKDKKPVQSLTLLGKRRQGTAGDILNKFSYKHSRKVYIQCFYLYYIESSYFLGSY